MNIIVEAERENQGKIQEAWAEHAAKLIPWAYRCLYSRDDTYPWWREDAEPAPGWRRKFSGLTGDELRRHFHGLGTIGTYTLGRDNHCLYVGVDIDAHDGQPADAVANLAYAMQLYDQANGLGAHPLLEDSNGKGGFHVWTRFDERVSGHLARSVVLWLVKDAPPAIHVEAFPKQAASPYGNQMRLPGKHHKRDHWSRFFDGEKWLAGEDAVQYMLAWEATDPQFFPEEARKYAPPKPPPKPPRPSANGHSWDDSDGHWVKQFDGNLRTLDIVALCDDRLTGDDGGDRCGILCPWHYEHTTGDDGTCVCSVAEDGRYPGFNCLHAHCQGRTLRNLLEFCGKEAVDKCCSERFGSNNHDLDEAVNEAIKPAELPKPSSNGEAMEEFVQDVVKQVAEKEKNTTSRAKPSRVVLEKWSQTKAIALQQQEDWLIKGWAEFGCLHAITGLPFSGKSSIIADIIAAMVRGEPWCEMNVKAVPFILLDLENKERILVKRLERAMQGDEGRMEELYSRINPRDLPEVPIPVEFIVECIEAVGAPKGFIIIDTMRTAFQRDSNDEKEMLALLTPLKLVAHLTGWCIIVLHHNAKFSNKYSGNTAFAGVLDYLWNWTRDGYKAELSLEGRDDAVQPLCFEFDMDEQRNIFQGTVGETAAADRQERSNLDLCRVLRHLSDSPNGATVSQIVVLSEVKKWSCTQLLGKGINAKCVIRVGIGGPNNPHTYYRTPAGKALVNQYAGKVLLG